MKNPIISFQKLAFISVSLLIASCSSNPTPQQETPSTTPPASSDLMKEAPAYDATKIDPSAPVTDITLDAVGNTMDEMKYDKTEIKVKAGSTVKLKLVNKASDASMEHNFVLIQEGTADKVAADGLKAGKDNNFVSPSPDVLVHTAVIGPGKEIEISFPAPAAGTYDFICTYPGHYSKMRGKFIVE
ncbi:MAG: cupredoxin domain-containing protein [Bacteroidia bacterium]|nr:cupredoxin domain-containing protein [Bacteroidia bacterium]